MTSIGKCSRLITLRNASIIAIIPSSTSPHGTRTGLSRQNPCSDHTHASHAIAGGMPIEVTQQNLGHASLATTTVYVKTEEKRRMKAVKKFWEARPGR